jgi:hypothetical protein
VRDVNALNGGTDFGFTADFIGTYKRYEGQILAENLDALDTPGEADRSGDFRVLLT